MKIKRGYGTYWEAYSRKSRRRVALYSDLEFEHFLLVEFDSAIADFIPQPKLEGAEFTPDMLVYYHDSRQQMREVKYAGTLEQPRVRQQIAQQVEWCRINNLPHAVVTEREIRLNRIWLVNCRLMLSQISLSRVDPLYRQLVLALLSDHQSKCLRDLCTFVSNGEREVFRQNLLILAQDGVVRTDLANKPLTSQTNFVLR